MDYVNTKIVLDPTLINWRKQCLKSVYKPSFKGEIVCFIIKVILHRWFERLNLILSESHSSWYFIHPGATKMYRDLREVYGGMGRRMILWNYWLSVIIVNRWKLNIKNQEVYLKILVFLLGSGKTWIWNSLLVYLTLGNNMIQFGLW